MVELTFFFWGKKHYAEYQSYQKTFPTAIIAFIVYPKDEEIRFILGESKVFTFHLGKGGIMTWECPDDTTMTKKLCETISEALYESENLAKDARKK